MLGFFTLWSAMAVVVLLMAAYRKIVARSEDDLVHLGDSDAVLVTRQKSVAGRLEFIDRWGTIFTIITVAFGLIIGTISMDRGWIESGQLNP